MMWIRTKNKHEEMQGVELKEENLAAAEDLSKTKFSFPILETKGTHAPK